MIIINAVILAALNILLTASVFAESIKDPVDAVTTKAGRLETWRYVNHAGDHGDAGLAEVTIEGKKIISEENVLGIRIVWPKSGPQADIKVVILAVDQPLPRLCETLFRVVDFSDANNLKISKLFGNCSAKIKVSKIQDKLRIEFPPFLSTGNAIYFYGESLMKNLAN